MQVPGESGQAVLFTLFLAACIAVSQAHGQRQRGPHEAHRPAFVCVHRNSPPAPTQLPAPLSAHRCWPPPSLLPVARAPPACRRPEGRRAVPGLPEGGSERRGLARGGQGRRERGREEGGGGGRPGLSPLAASPLPWLRCAPARPGGASCPGPLSAPSSAACRGEPSRSRARSRSRSRTRTGGTFTAPRCCGTAPPPPRTSSCSSPRGGYPERRAGGRALPCRALPCPAVLCPAAPSRPGSARHGPARRGALPARLFPR